jgi:D-glycero-alpha-D-manno-heptose-7-phosphate kinase
LHYKLLRYFAAKRVDQNQKDHLEQDLVFSTRAKSPAGAGLGGSSALNVAMTGALASWAQGSPVDPLKQGEELIEICRDIETTVIQVPAGLQDYYGAMFGGLQALRWRAGKHSREWLPDEILGGIEERLMLFYSGQSRNSGINNWVLFKGFIDNQDGIRERFGRIASATAKLERSLREKDWMKAGDAIAEEWATRKTLASGISTEKMNHAFAEANRITPVSGKVCGAGGGGCFFIYNSKPDATARKRIEEAFIEQGMRPLPYRASPKGLEVRLENR